MAGPTENTKVLMSFGAWTGGFEFAMQLRWDIYKKFGKSPDGDPAFCYLDAESLRVDSKTTYTYDPKTDKNMMGNPDWDKHYEAAMKNCKTMILLITKEWLISRWCWKELDMLLGVAEWNPSLKVIVVMWPGGVVKLKSGVWTERQEGGVSRTPQDLYDRLEKLKNAIYVRVSGSPAIIGELASGGSNTFAYSCSLGEATLILANTDV